MPHPLLYEINTRCWLRELVGETGAPATLASVPDAELASWRASGFTHIWLMGVWTGGPRARARASEGPGLRRAYDEALPDWRPEDVAASPYAVAEYRIPPQLGGEEGLREFRRRLHARDLKLLLDFVPNHVGLDHPWIHQRPELFVQSPAKTAETFAVKTRDGMRWLAHGRDPNFPAWSDTVQLDFRRPETRAAMTDTLLAVAAHCDGVRCDMAMLPLNEVFTSTWKSFPPLPPAPPLQEEFWTTAISAVRKVHPDFLFLAEVYWGLESKLQALGFNYTYDKELYDGLVARDGPGVQRHLLTLPPGVLAAGTHFLENHDEARIASRLALPEHRAAALLTLSLPGMRLLHEGQLWGACRKTPVQLLRRLAEPKQREIVSLYEQLLTVLPAASVGQGTGELLAPRPAWPGNLTHENIIVLQWQGQAPCFSLAAVNLAAHRSQCYAPLTVQNLPMHNWAMNDLLGEERYVRSGDDLHTQGLYLDLQPHAAQLFRFRPA